MFELPLESSMGMNPELVGTIDVEIVVVVAVAVTVTGEVMVDVMVDVAYSVEVVLNASMIAGIDVKNTEKTAMVVVDVEGDGVTTAVGCEVVTIMTISGAFVLV